MRNRTIKKQIWLNQTEDNLLKEKSKKANISEAEFLRNCINGFEVQEKPDENFYYILSIFIIIMLIYIIWMVIMGGINLRQNQITNLSSLHYR